MSESPLQFTEAAAAKVGELIRDEGNPALMLRVYVQGGGCSGMQYGMVFDEKRENDLTVEYFGVPVLVDAVSADYLRGAVIDYSDSLTGGGFKITNPKAKSSCGCGKSFEA